MALITREMMSSYSQADGGTIQNDLFIRDVDDFVPLVARDDHAIVNLIKVKGSGNKLKYEHGSGDLPTNLITATANKLSTDLTITVSNGTLVQQWQQIYNKTTGETMRVTAVPSGNDLTVTRGHESTAAAITSGDELLLLGPAVPEGVDTPRSPWQAGDLDWDTYQIFEYSWSLSHRANVTPDYEIKGKRFQTMLKRYMKMATRDLAMTMIYGARHLGAGDQTDASGFRGLRKAATANVIDLGGAALTPSDFLDLLQQQYMDVGKADMAKTFYLHPFMKRVVNSFFNKARRATATDAKLNLTLDGIDTDFGLITFEIDYEMPKNEIYTINTKDVFRQPYEGGTWKTGMLSTQGWYDTGFLRGDWGVIWPLARRRGAIVDINTTEASYPDLDKIFANAA